MGKGVNWLMEKWGNSDNPWVLFAGLGVLFAACMAIPYAVIYGGLAVLPASWIPNFYGPAPLWLVLLVLLVCWPRKSRD